MWVTVKNPTKLLPVQIEFLELFVGWLGWNVVMLDPNKIQKINKISFCFVENEKYFLKNKIKGEAMWK